MKRKSGVLLPVASLPSPYGIGSFSKEAYTFIDQLEHAGQSYWQILPLGPTGYGDSPYQSFSTFAGNPYFIDLEALQNMGWLTKEECDSYDFGNNACEIDYYKLNQSRNELLKKAFERGNISENIEFWNFCKEEEKWLNDYCLYVVIKKVFEGKSWIEWEEDIRFRKEEAVRQYMEKYEEEVLFHKFLQFLFIKQWKNLKSYANERGIKIIGDIPIYVAFDSADTWSKPELFQLDERRNPTAVAGCPPDAFSDTGQLWGNPLYKWSYHRNTRYEWWIRRMESMGKLYDIVRIDHFRGFDEYYSIPYGHDTAQYGVWEKGPGMEFFHALKENIGETEIIAEDLGFLTPSVFQLLEETGFPGMKVLQFAFGSREDGHYLPHNYSNNTVVYTGTHDNNTTKDWYQNLSEYEKEFVQEYLGMESLEPKEAVWGIIRLAMGSVAKRCIVPIQDYLEKGGEARINEPSTLGGNWTWRMENGELTKTQLKKIKTLTQLYGRI